MLRPERMSELSVLVKNTDKDKAIAVLAKEKAVHLIDHKKKSVQHVEIDVGTPREDAATLSDALTKTQFLLHKLPKKEKKAESHSIEQRIARINELASTYERHQQEMSKIAEEKNHLLEKKALLQHLTAFPEPIEVIFNTKSVQNVLVERTSESKELPIKPILVTETAKNILLITTKKDVTAKLKEAEYNIINIAPLQGLKGKIPTVIHHLDRELTTLARRQEKEEKAKESFASHWNFLEDSKDILTLELLKAQAPLHFGTTKHVTLIKGFIPTKNIAKLHNAFQEQNVHTVFESAPATIAPTKLQNAPGVKSFEALLRLYTLPKYNEIDPTSIMALTFPIFFGFMLGDIGYGILLLAIFMALHHFIPSSRPLAQILMISSISAIVFGFVYGEIFGMSSIFGIHLHHFVHRTNDLTTMFTAAILLGAFHLNLGLVLGMINEAKEKGWIKSIVEKGSWILLQVGAILVAAAYGKTAGLPIIGGITVGKIVAYSVLGLAIAGIAYSERLKGLIELPMIFSHTLSYTRLVAIGLSSAYIAFVVNDMGSGLFAKGGVWMLFSVLVVITGHTVNLALGLLGPFLHSLRLHYAEFFMKFYEGGGEIYKPFGMEAQTWQ